MLVQGTAMTSAQPAQRYCVSCGRTIDWNADICQYCGHDYRPQVHVAQPSKKDHTGLLIIAVVVIVIVIVVVLPLLLYIMVVGFGSPSDGYTPSIQVLTKMRTTGGYKIAFTPPTREVVWSDLTIQLNDGMNSVSWHPDTLGLTSATPPAVWRYSSGQQIGSIDVWLNVTDLDGNGQINAGDCITLTTSGGAFSASTSYTLTMLYEPTGGSMVSYVFTG